MADIDNKYRTQRALAGGFSYALLVYWYIYIYNIYLVQNCIVRSLFSLSVLSVLLFTLIQQTHTLRFCVPKT